MCREKSDEIIELPRSKEEELREAQRREEELRGLRERERRTVLRKLEREAALAKAGPAREGGGEGDEDGHADGDDGDEDDEDLDEGDEGDDDNDDDEVEEGVIRDGDDAGAEGVASAGAPPSKGALPKDELDWEADLSGDDDD